MGAGIGGYNVSQEKPMYEMQKDPKKPTLSDFLARQGFGNRTDLYEGNLNGVRGTSSAAPLQQQVDPRTREAMQVAANNLGIGIEPESPMAERARQVAQQIQPVKIDWSQVVNKLAPTPQVAVAVEKMPRDIILEDDAVIPYSRELQPPSSTPNSMKPVERGGGGNAKQAPKNAAKKAPATSQARSGLDNYLSQLRVRRG